MNGGKVESCNRIKDKTVRTAVEEMSYKRLGRSTLLSICVALMLLQEVIILGETK